jgi:long-chain acyl-CoA synthetase
MESALTMDPLIEQAMVVGEGRQYLAALLVLSDGRWRELAAGLGRSPGALADPVLLAAVQSRVDERLQDFPGHARVRAIHLTLEPWTIENGLLTPTLKLKRPVLTARFADAIEGLYRKGRSNVAPRSAGR